MLDKTSTSILSFIFQLPEETFDVNHTDFPKDISPSDFISTCEYLEKEGYLSITWLGDNKAFWKATLTHKGKHFKEFNSIALKRYLLDKWIDILALVISILAFIGAYRQEFSGILRLIEQALTR